MKLLSTLLSTVLVTILYNVILVYGSVNNTVEINRTTINGPVLNSNDYYGVGISGIGLLDGDGIPDLAVGAYYDDAGGASRGTVHIHFMNSNGSVKSTIEINSTTPNGPILNDTDLYGASIANLGQLDGDGIPDLAVGAYYASGGGSHRGAVHIHFMNSNGTVKSSVEIDSTTTNGPIVTDNDEFGLSLAGLGLFDEDSTVDLAVGAPYFEGGGVDRGSIFLLFLNNDGSIKTTIKLDETTPNGAALIDGDRYGRSVCNMGDIDGDSITDIAVGAYQDDAGGNNRGTVHIHFMNNNGSIKSTVEINSLTPNGPTLSDNDNYGNSITNLGDIDFNGVPDMAVGAHNSDIGGNNRGAVYIHYLNSDGSVINTEEINSTTINGPTLSDGDLYARGLNTIGDLNGDGMPELAVGAYYAETTNEGKAFIHFLEPVATPTVLPTSTITMTNTPTPTITPTMLFSTLTITPTQTSTIRPSLLSNVMVYPNPFNVTNQQALIQYELNQDADMVITIYNYLGSTIKGIKVNVGEPGGQGQPEGHINQIKWDGRNSHGQLQAAGGYICQIVANGKQKQHIEKAVLKIALIR